MVSYRYNSFRADMVNCYCTSQLYHKPVRIVLFYTKKNSVFMRALAFRKRLYILASEVSTIESFKLVDARETLAQLDGLFGRDCPIGGSLYLLQRGLAVSVRKRRNVESLTEIANPFGILAVFLWLGILGMRVGDKTGLLKET